MIATYLTHSQDCDLMVKCPSNTFDVKQGEKYVLQQYNSNEYTSYVDSTDRVVKWKMHFSSLKGLLRKVF